MGGGGSCLASLPEAENKGVPDRKDSVNSIPESPDTTAAGGFPSGLNAKPITPVISNTEVDTAVVRMPTGMTEKGGTPTQRKRSDSKSSSWRAEVQQKGKEIAELLSGSGSLPSMPRMPIDGAFQGEGELLPTLPPQPFEKGELLGAGSFARVYKAKQTDTGRVIAVKEFVLEGALSVQLSAIASEVKTMRSVHHPNVVACLGAQYVEKDSLINLFLEFAPGGSIGHLVLREGPLSPITTRNYTAQIVRALAHLHELKIIHRDLKGANCLLAGTGNEIVKLADFGSAARSAVGFVTQQSAENGIAMKGMRGTAFFMAPEVIKGEGYGRRSDVWSLGGTVVTTGLGQTFS